MSSRTQKLKRLNDLELDLRRRELPGMVGRNEVEAELQQIEKELRELVTAYEQYFIGADPVRTSQGTTNPHPAPAAHGQHLHPAD